MPQANDTPDNLLLQPIFGGGDKASSIGSSEKDQQNFENPFLVQLAPLSNEQRRKLAKALRVLDEVMFMHEIDKNRLEVFAQRPGDLIELVHYWNKYKRFDKFSAMVEHGIRHKLAETDRFRADNAELSSEKLREGIECVASSLTLGKSFTIREIGEVPRDALASDALASDALASDAMDPEKILVGWKVAEINALMRRAVFSPSTYGRVRFHHRATQEYLAACWFERLHRQGCPIQEIFDLIFSERYGIETVVPSMRGVAAWLALKYGEILDGLIRREPLILIQHGDPGSISIEAKRRILLSYAMKHFNAEISSDSLDHRAVRLFADVALANTIREVWNQNERVSFRVHLLRIVREGAINDCVDLATIVGLNSQKNDYYRIVACEALLACQASAELSELSRIIVKYRMRLTHRLLASLCEILFPNYMDVRSLFKIIAAVGVRRKKGLQEVHHSIDRLYHACKDRQQRKDFIKKLSALCLAPPFLADWQRISKSHAELARYLVPIATCEVRNLRTNTSSSDVVRLLMVIERSEGNYSGERAGTLSELVRSNAALNRDLFWADVEEQREFGVGKREQDLTEIWQLSVHHNKLWGIGLPDLPWLFDDLSSERFLGDRCIALSYSQHSSSE